MITEVTGAFIVLILIRSKSLVVNLVYFFVIILSAFNINRLGSNFPFL
ncbi:unnamed protein product [Commensalibacter papalotli (ex Botero et al. 2024)]|nr:unnamed protein product [Commensalibacter papalotli (ex Botero et al. 2024)]